MTKLFKNFVSVWGAKWTSHLNGNKEIMALSVVEWADSLHDLTDEQITSAFRICKNTLEWCPTISQFKRIALDILPTESAFELARDAMTGSKTNNFFGNALVEKCAKKISSWEWANEKNSSLLRSFASVYEKEANSLLNGQHSINRHNPAGLPGVVCENSIESK